MNSEIAKQRLSEVARVDTIASSYGDFMATHVPFRDLEFIEFGDTQANAIHLNENQIYDQYIVNRANKHQMLIVRGTNGTGKSHLICWLHNRFVIDKDTVLKSLKVTTSEASISLIVVLPTPTKYSDASEKLSIIFLSRTSDACLDNSG